MKDILARLRKYEIRMRKAIDSQMRGDYQSVFKGSGLTFDDVRAYQYGDDVRMIDWNVSAKGHGMFVKIFREEKEQTVFFLLDVSASQEIGQENQQKIDVAKEICGVLALSAIKEAGLVGLICFSDKKEKYIKPGKGLKHGYELLLQLFQVSPVSRKTNLNAAFHFALERIKRRSIIIVVSDFIDENYGHSLVALAKKHDVVIIHLSDAREISLPNLGIIPMLQQETGKTVWVNTSASGFKNMLLRDYQDRQQHLEKLCRKQNINYLALQTHEDFVPQLVRLFRVRNVRK